MLHRSRIMKHGVRSFIIAVATLVLLTAVSGVGSGLAKDSPARLYGEVKGTNAKVIQVQVADKVLAVSADVAIRDEEGYARRVNEVYRGVQVVLHLKKGQIVEITLLAD